MTAVPVSELIALTFPIRADVVLAGGGFADEHPETWAAYATSRRYGSCRCNVTATLSAEQWRQVAQFFRANLVALNAAVARIDSRTKEIS